MVISDRRIHVLGRFRIGGIGLEHVSYDHSSPCENRGREPRVSLTISALATPQHHGGVHARLLPEVLWRGPEGAGGGRRHDRGLPEHRRQEAIEDTDVILSGLSG